jgi:hypothetical protein
MSVEQVNSGKCILCRSELHVGSVIGVCVCTEGRLSREPLSRVADKSGYFFYTMLSTKVNMYLRIRGPHMGLSYSVSGELA